MRYCGSCWQERHEDFLGHSRYSGAPAGHDGGHSAAFANRPLRAFCRFLFRQIIGEAASMVAGASDFWARHPGLAAARGDFQQGETSCHRIDPSCWRPVLVSGSAGGSIDDSEPDSERCPDLHLVTSDGSAESSEQSTSS